MGFVDTTTNPQLPWFYNVVHAVGQNSPNLRDDVRLVQYMLKRIYIIGMAIDTGDSIQTFSTPKGNMVVDGVCGPVTLNWILKFQLDIRKTGNSILPDKRADRARGNKIGGSISHTIYTIIWLNYLLMYNDTQDYAVIWQRFP